MSPWAPSRSAVPATSRTSPCSAAATAPAARRAGTPGLPGRASAWFQKLVAQYFDREPQDLACFGAS
eukprot:3913523-Alexandrium_andersonii.AAC.1